MNCPHCKTELIVTERGGIEVEECPRCGGIWLDKGDMERIVDRTEATATMSARSMRYSRGDRDDYHDEPRDYAARGPGRRPTWFEDLFRSE